MYHGWTPAPSPKTINTNLRLSIAQMTSVDYLQEFERENKILDVPLDERNRRLTRKLHQLPFELAEDCDCNGANRWGCERCQPVITGDEIPF